MSQSISQGLEIGHAVGACKCGSEPAGSNKMRGISWLAEDLLTSQERLCSMEMLQMSKMLVLAKQLQWWQLVNILVFVSATTAFNPRQSGGATEGSDKRAFSL